GHTTTRREEALVHTPEFGNLTSMLRVLQLTVAGQSRAARPLAGSHGVALSGTGQAGAARLPNVAGDEVKIVDARDAIGAMSTLIDAHGPDAHGCPRIGIQTGPVTDGVLVNATYARRRGRVIILNHGAELLEAAAVGIDIGLVVKPLLEDDVRQAVEQHQVRARGDGQVDIGKLREHGDARIDHDNREATPFQCFLQSPVDDWVLLRQVGAKGDETVGVVEILVASRWAVGAKRAFVAGDGRGHAQRGIAVIVVGADDASDQLAQSIELFGHYLPGRHHGEGIAPVFFLDITDTVGHGVQGRVPTDSLIVGEVMAAQQGLRTAACRGKELMFEDALDAELAPIDIRAGGAATGHGYASLIEADVQGATGRAV